MIRLACLAFAIVASSTCRAQETTTPDLDPTRPELSVATPPPNDTASTCCRIASGTPLTLELLETLDSSLLKRGDRFRIRLAEALAMDGYTLIASGTEGIGEVVHAERSRGGGKAGELLIAARHLDHQGVKVPLRGLKMGGAGKDKTATALALSFATGPFALFLQGDEIVIPAGSLAEAKVAHDIDVLPLQAGDAAATSGITLPPTPAAVPADAAGIPTDTPSAQGMPPASAPTSPQVIEVPPIRQPQE